ncbi:cupin domain-containing protein [bacterium]|nr:cupin domain-containing protein [bacterium]
MSDLIQITYKISCPPGVSIEQLSMEIALEQTVEVPLECIPTREIRESVVGQVLEIAPVRTEQHQYNVKIGYHPDLTAYQIPQFLNLLFGNISMKKNIRIVELSLPDRLVASFSGPKSGIAGLRSTLGVFNRPLAATALKPLGSDPARLASLAEAFARGGGDIIKDDHSLADQPFCPFRERVSQCQRAIARANSKTGHNTLYFPNISGSWEQMQAQVEYVVSQDVKGILLSPWLIGPDFMRYLAKQYSLIIMAHPAFAGTYFHDPSHGIKPAILLGTLFRWWGADISIFPNYGGRFSFNPQDCREVSQALRAPWGNILPAWPAPAGGMSLDNIGEMKKEYGQDAIYLIGGALLKHSQDLSVSTRDFMEAIHSNFPKQPEVSAKEMISKRPQHSWAEKSFGKILEHLPLQDDFCWTGRDPFEYKQKEQADFKDITRHELIGRYGESTSFDLRYFQIEPKGYSSPEKHRHEHVIICIRGQGILRQGNKAILLKEHDIAYVPPFQEHQLKNESDQPFGFFCIVDHVRDRPIKLGVI